MAARRPSPTPPGAAARRARGGGRRAPPPTTATSAKARKHGKKVDGARAVDGADGAGDPATVVVDGALDA